MIAYIDTHIAIRLAQAQVRKISKEAARIVNAANLLVSPAVLLEMEILYEIERFDRSPQAMLAQLRTEIELKVCDLPFPDVAEMAGFEGWTRDPFDRLIVAQARLRGNAPLITADERILQNYPRAVW